MYVVRVLFQKCLSFQLREWKKIAQKCVDTIQMNNTLTLDSVVFLAYRNTHTHTDNTESFTLNTHISVYVSK